MPGPSPDPLGPAAGVWRAGRAVIMQFPAELRPDLTEAQHAHNAAAVIARLASHDPPIVLEFVVEE
jgi:hypothetical protein